MQLRGIRTWRDKTGKRRKIRLCANYENMHARVAGTTHDGRGGNNWKGLPVEWQTFNDFREWALASGYSKLRCSLDRIDNSKGYGPDNCQFLTRREHAIKSNGARR